MSEKILTERRVSEKEAAKMRLVYLGTEGVRGRSSRGHSVPREGFMKTGTRLRIEVIYTKTKGWLGAKAEA
jgi:hypothetical protein